MDWYQSSTVGMDISVVWKIGYNPSVMSKSRPYNSHQQDSNGDSCMHWCKSDDAKEYQGQGKAAHSWYLDTRDTRARVSKITILTMVFRFGLSAEKGWRKLRGFRWLAEVINSVKYIDGINEKTTESQRGAVWSCWRTQHLTMSHGISSDPWIDASRNVCFGNYPGAGCIVLPVVR